MAAPVLAVGDRALGFWSAVREVFPETREQRCWWPAFLRLDAYPYRNMMAPMARAATTSDVFNAIAEPRRREILVLLRAGERPVTELAQELGMTQPGASKHLRVLREVGLVRDRKAGKQRLYGIDARGLRPVHEWTGGFERFWNESFDRLDAYVRDLKQAKQEE